MFRRPWLRRVGEQILGVPWLAIVDIDYDEWGLALDGLLDRELQSRQAGRRAVETDQHGA